jgi:hypothetical protein
MGGGCQQQGGGGQGKGLEDAVAAIPEGKVNETRHGDWTAPSAHCNGIDSARLRLLALAATFGHPLAPFVVSEERGQDDYRADKDEEDLHTGCECGKDSTQGVT